MLQLYDAVTHFCKHFNGWPIFCLQISHNSFFIFLSRHLGQCPFGGSYAILQGALLCFDLQGIPLGAGAQASIRLGSLVSCLTELKTPPVLCPHQEYARGPSHCVLIFRDRLLRQQQQQFFFKFKALYVNCFNVFSFDFFIEVGFSACVYNQAYLHFVKLCMGGIVLKNLKKDHMQETKMGTRKQAADPEPVP